MVRLKRVSASQELSINQYNHFSADDILSLLRSIEELKDCDIKLGLSTDNHVAFLIGEYEYDVPIG